MSYIFRKIWFMILRNKGVYLLLILEMTVGMSMYVYSCNLSYSIQEKKQGWQELETDRLLRISVKEESAIGELPIEWEDYNYIQMLTEENVNLFFDIPDIMILGDQIVNYDLLFLDFQKYGLNPDSTYMGEQIQSKINNAEVQLGIENISIDETQIVLNLNTNTQKYFEMTHLPHGLNDKTLKSELREENIVFSNAILFPIQEMNLLFNGRKSNVGSFQLGIKSENIPDVENVLNSIVSYLLERHGSFYDYKFYSPLAELQSDMYKVELDINAINKIGLFLLITVLVASISLFRMLLGSRERELGICQAFGAGMGVIMAEIVLEVFLVCLVGTVAGCIGGFVLTYNFTSFLTQIVKMTGHWQTVLISFLICIVITAIVSIATIQKLYYKETMELIRSKS